MSTAKEELVASSIRKQMAYLEGLLKELGSEPDRTAIIQQRIREVENQLQKLRSQFTF